MTAEEIEAYTDILVKRLEQFHDGVLTRIGRRILRTHKLSMTDAKAINSIANINGDIEEIKRELAKITETNIKDIDKLFRQVIGDQSGIAKPLYAFRGEKYIPFGDDLKAQAIAERWIRDTALSMVNLSKTRMLGFMQGRQFLNLDYVYHDAVDKAILNIAAGTEDFYSAMRDTLKDIGGSGLRVHYVSEAGRITNRRLDTSVRQNILWGIKEASQEYQNVLSDRLGCDGFEVDYHPNPRPSHAFMGGVIFSYDGDKIIDGKYYPDGSEALERLQDYGCLHFKTGLILGLSQPSWDSEELARRKQEDKQLIEYNDKAMTGYEWQQQQRMLETEIRKQKDIANLAKAAGDDVLRRETQAKINALQAKSNNIALNTGIYADDKRKSVSGYHRVKTQSQLWTTEVKGTKTSNGIVITEVSQHFYDQAKKRDILEITTKENIINTLTEPLKIGKIKTDDKGRTSQQFLGNKLTIGVNNKTGILTTVWRTSSKTSEKLKRGAK